MNINDINPYVRFVRYLDIKDTEFDMCIPRDCRLFFVSGGTGEIVTPLKTFTMKKSDILLINSGMKYHLKSGDVQYLAINFDYTCSHSHINIPIPPLPCDAEGFECIENVKFNDYHALNGYMHVKDMYHLKSFLVRLYQEHTKKLPYFEEKERSMMSFIIYEILRCAETAHSNNRVDIDRVIEYLHEHYNEDIKAEELGEIFHFHPNYINQVFKKTIGTSVHQYIMSIRLSNAIAMLENSDISIGDIARETGFYDSSYFSRYIKKMTGMAPKEYR